MEKVESTMIYVAYNIHSHPTHALLSFCTYPIGILQVYRIFVSQAMNEERYSTLPFNHQKVLLPHIPCSALQNTLNINI